MDKPYKEKYTLQERIARMKGFQESEPDKIMVIVQKHQKSRLPSLANNRFLTFKNFKFAQVKTLIQKRIKERMGKQKQGKQSFFIFVNGKVPNMQDTMETVWQKFQDKDGILYISYQEQQSF